MSIWIDVEIYFFSSLQIMETGIEISWCLAYATKMYGNEKKKTLLLIPQIGIFPPTFNPTLTPPLSLSELWSFAVPTTTAAITASSEPSKRDSSSWWLVVVALTWFSVAAAGEEKEWRGSAVVVVVVVVVVGACIICMLILSASIFICAVIWWNWGVG